MREKALKNKEAALKKQQYELQEQTEQLIALKSLHSSTEDKLKNANEEIRLLKLRFLASGDVKTSHHNEQSEQKQCHPAHTQPPANHISDLCNTIATVTLSNIANNIQTSSSQQKENDVTITERLNLLQSAFMENLQMVQNNLGQLTDTVNKLSKDFHRLDTQLYNKYIRPQNDLEKSKVSLPVKNSTKVNEAVHQHCSNATKKDVQRSKPELQNTKKECNWHLEWKNKVTSLLRFNSHESANKSCDLGPSKSNETNTNSDDYPESTESEMVAESLKETDHRADAASTSTHRVDENNSECHFLE